MIVGRVRRDSETAEFLDGTARGAFVLRRCTNCDHVSGPQAVQCPVCESDKFVPKDASGVAKVVSWIVAYGKRGEDGQPSRDVVAIGELDEGPWWWAQVCDAEPDEMVAGALLRIDFARPADEDEAVPIYRLTQAAG